MVSGVVVGVRRAASMLLVVALAGCTGLGGRLKPVEPLVNPPADGAEALAIARDLAARDRWSEALSYLDSAALSLPDAETLAGGRARLLAEWEREERALEDQILVGDAENLRNKVGLLEKLSVAQPDDLVLTSRRIYWKEVLVNQVDGLTACAEVHVADRPTLAKRCFDVASWLQAGPQIDERLAVVDEHLRTIESVAAERRQAKEMRERQARAKVLLNNTKSLIEAHNYRAALDTLDKLAELQPDNPEVVGLREEAMSMISPQIEALVKLGDHLYLDEQLEAAVATWQAALTLKPGDEEILARIERAKTVLSKLETLRLQQKGPAARQPQP